MPSFPVDLSAFGYESFGSDFTARNPFEYAGKLVVFGTDTSGSGLGIGAWFSTDGGFTWTIADQANEPESFGTGLPNQALGFRPGSTSVVTVSVQTSSVFEIDLYDFDLGTLTWNTTPYGGVVQSDGGQLFCGAIRSDAFVAYVQTFTGNPGFALCLPGGMWQPTQTFPIPLLATIVWGTYPAQCCAVDDTCYGLMSVDLPPNITQLYVVSMDSGGTVLSALFEDNVSTDPLYNETGGQMNLIPAGPWVFVVAVVTDEITGKLLKLLLTYAVTPALPTTPYAFTLLTLNNFGAIGISFILSVVDQLLYICFNGLAGDTYVSIDLTDVTPSPSTLLPLSGIYSVLENVVSGSDVTVPGTGLGVVYDNTFYIGPLGAPPPSGPTILPTIAPISLPDPRATHRCK